VTVFFVVKAKQKETATAPTQRAALSCSSNG
jgi:hypothetical protein